jgi:transposase
MPAQMIDKGIPAPGLLAQVVVAKHDDHLPLYRQKEIYAMLERAHCALEHGVVDWHLRGTPDTAGPGAQGVHPGSCRGARR